MRASIAVFTFASILCLALPGVGQGQTWIVDANNGPGTNFLDIPPAVAAAQEGDKIIVRPYASGPFYSGAVIDKAITLVTEGSVGGTYLLTPANNTAFLMITGIPAGKTVVVEGVWSLSFPGTVRFISVRNCAGRVHLDNISAATHPTVNPLASRSSTARM